MSPREHVFHLGLLAMVCTAIWLTTTPAAVVGVVLGWRMGYTVGAIEQAAETE